MIIQIVNINSSLIRICLLRVNNSITRMPIQGAKYANNLEGDQQSTSATRNAIQYAEGNLLLLDEDVTA